MYWWKAQDKLDELKNSFISNDPSAHEPVTRTELNDVLNIIAALAERLDDKCSDLQRDIDRKQDDPDRSNY